MESGGSTARVVELSRQYFEFADSGGSQIEGEYRGTPLNAFELGVIHRLNERGYSGDPPSTVWLDTALILRRKIPLELGNLANLAHLFLSR